MYEIAYLGYQLDAFYLVYRQLQAVSLWFANIDSLSPVYINCHLPMVNRVLQRNSQHLV